MLSRLPAWTLRIVLPPHLGSSANHWRQAAWNQLATPLREPVLGELRWYFDRLRDVPSGSLAEADNARFQRSRRAFQSSLFRVLYRAWQQDGEAVLTVAASPAISHALTSGAAKIETLVLPHAYSHLSPLVAVA